MILKRQIKNLTELEEFSKILIKLLKPNTFLLLEGELGVGKTTLTQLIAKNLGIREKITSPTFNILQQYQIKSNYYLNHFDFFRLNKSDNLEAFQELTIDNLNIIEWPDKNPQFWQKEQYIKVKLVKQNWGMRTAIFSTSYPIKSVIETNILNFFLLRIGFNLALKSFIWSSKLIERN